MKILLFFLLCTFSFGQEDSTKCDLRIANEKWIEKFIKTTSISKKINLIRIKIKADTVFQENNDPELYCDYKVKFILRYPKRKKLGIFLTTNTNEKIIQKLDSTNIRSIDIIKMPHGKRGFYCTDPEPLPRIIYIFLNT